MKRREAIQRLTIVGFGLSLWPSCRVEEVPTLSRVKLNADQWNLLRQFTEGILPVDHEEYPTLEPRPNFILTILNDCTPQSDLNQYLSGLEKFSTYLQDTNAGSLDDLNEDQLSKIYGYLESSDDEALAKFYNTTKALAKQHFTTSERYMTEQLQYKFVPGAYMKCVNV